MHNESDIRKLVEDLQLVKSAVARSNSIFRFINISQAMALVGLWGGIGIAVLAGFSYFLTAYYGEFAAAPLVLQVAFYIFLALFLAAVGILKIKMILKHARKTDQEITVHRLIDDVYTPQTISLVLPFALAGGGILAFLISGGLGIYIVPAFSILLGLIYISLVNVFYFKEMYVTGNWLLFSGLITLFYAERIPLSLAVIITFACSFILLYAANRFMGKAR